MNAVSFHCGLIGIFKSRACEVFNRGRGCVEFIALNRRAQSSIGDSFVELNQIPRQKGLFYWTQINGAVAAGARMLYVAMFDEMDEGTAIFKCTAKLPVGPVLTDFDGCPPDYYLRLTGEAGKLLKGNQPVGAPLLPAALPGPALLLR